MTTRSRLLAAFAMLALGEGGAFAQPAIAPPPHETLDDVVKEYLRLGLPLPPKEAELVRIKLIRESNGIDEVEGIDSRHREPYYLVGFQLKPTAPKKDPRYL